MSDEIEVTPEMIESAKKIDSSEISNLCDEFLGYGDDADLIAIYRAMAHKAAEQGILPLQMNSAVSDDHIPITGILPKNWRDLIHLANICVVDVGKADPTYWGA